MSWIFCFVETSDGRSGGGDWEIMGNRGKGSTYRKKIFIYFMAIAIVPLLILGVYSYHSATMAVRKNIRQANETALIQVENKAETVLDTVRQNFLKIASGSLVGEIVEQEYDGIPYPKLRDFMEEISGDEAYINYVGGYSFVNYKKGWVMSNKGVTPFSAITNAEWLEELKTDGRKMFWRNRVGDSFGNELMTTEYINDDYLTFVVKSPTYTSYNDAAFVVNISQDAFERLLKDSLGNGSLIVFDENDRLVYTENGAVSEFYEKSPEALGNLEETGIHTGAGDFDIVKRRAALSGWTFIAAYDPAMADGQLRQILITMTCIILVVLVLIGVISSFGTFRVYQPVQNLVTQVKGIVPQEGETDEDEFGLIHKGIYTLVGHNEELQDLIERQKGQLTELFAFRLIRGRLNQEEIRQTKERLKIAFGNCMCVVSVIFCQKADREREQMEQDVLNLELLKNMPEEIRNILLFPPFVHTRAIVMILDGVDEAKVEEKILALRNCLSVYVAEACEGYVDMGVSQIFTEEVGFRWAYNESIEALKINEYYDRDEDTEGISMEDSSVTYYADLTRQNTGSAGYNLVLDTAIKTAVDEGDQAKAYGIVDEFMRDINKSGVVLYEQQYYQQRFLLAILSVPADAGIPIHDIFPEGEGNLFARFNQLYDTHTIRKFYEREVIAPVIARMNQFRKSSSEVVLDKIMRLIEARGGDLTLAECADQLGYHPSYIWRVMKNTKDMTFTDYIAGQKLELAKQMLAETELPVAEIAERLSYSNAQNFIRVFKKHMGMTPGQYRKEARN